MKFVEIHNFEILTQSNSISDPLVVYLNLFNYSKFEFGIYVMQFWLKKSFLREVAIQGLWELIRVWNAAVGWQPIWYSKSLLMNCFKIHINEAIWYSYAVATPHRGYHVPHPFGWMKIIISCRSKWTSTYS